MNITMENAASVAADKLKQLAAAAQSVMDGGRNKYFNTNKKGMCDNSALLQAEA